MRGKKEERKSSIGYRRFNLRTIGLVTIWDSGDTGEVIDYHGTDLSPLSCLLPLFPPVSYCSSSCLFLILLPSSARVADARIYTWRLLWRYTLVWMEAEHSMAPRTVKRKIYGFRRNQSRKSILQDERRERHGEENKRERDARKSQAKKGEMDFLYFGGRHLFLNIYNCTLCDWCGFLWLMMLVDSVAQTRSQNYYIYIYIYTYHSIKQ